jgi:O-antigen/teichoic acid export membrane protein
MVEHKPEKMSENHEESTLFAAQQDSPVPNLRRTMTFLGQNWPSVTAYLRRLDPSLHRRIVSGAAWSIAGAGIASGFTMLSNIASARFLGATHYGELAIVLSTTNLFTTLFSTGVGMTATRFVAEHRNSDPVRAGVVAGLSSATSILVGAIIALAIVVLAPWLSRSVLGAFDLVGALRLAAAVLFFASVNASQTGILSGLEAFDVIALGNLLRGVSILVLVTAGAALRGVTGALLGYIVVGALTAVFYQIAVRRQCSLQSITTSYWFRREDFGILSRFTLPALVAAFSFTPAAWWSNVILATRSGYSEAGILNSVLHWQMVILFFSTAISSTALPMLSNVRAERDAAKYKKCLALSFLLTTAPAIAIALPVAICSAFIMRMYGPGFEHGATALVLISVASVLSAANIPVGNAIWSLDATVAAVLLALLRGGALVVCSYAFATRGATGIAMGYLIMGAIQTAATIPLMMWILRRRFSAEALSREAALV